MNNNRTEYTINSILVPIDFSDLAKNSLRYAANLAKGINAKIQILHVYNIPLIPGRTNYVYQPENIREEIQTAEQQLKSLPTEIPELNNIEYETKTLPGYGEMEIADIIRSQKADLIIMGTKGATGIKEVITGNNTASVFENSGSPLLVIPEQSTYQGISTIGFAYDKGVSEEEIKMLVSIIKLFKAVVHIFHVKENTGNTETEEASSITVLENYLYGTNYTYERFYNADVAEGIEKYALLKNMDMIAMIPRKHNVVDALFKGSITKKMTSFNTIPILTIPDRS